ncbi:hypothetical protein, partial [Pseudomonas poae]|uniref:hypothetical protein n=1 Tax=Pseudomonas poae TaxID=200451 RepID=UPI0034D47629
VRSVIRFLSARNLPAAEIHRQICEVYDDTVMSESKVHKWVRQFKDGRDNIHDEDRSGRPSLITDDLVASVEARIREEGILKLVQRYDKCLNKLGNYVEK